MQGMSGKRIDHRREGNALSVCRCENPWGVSLDWKLFPDMPCMKWVYRDK